ncbi:FkbM family methyltransferase [Shewanella insulae]|uniref:FkbM family methyltransferase n=1 Tax=Shewanella insulae TaxID=2681496 RepID=UPI0024801BB8|nr:FkbM family methyltransferase [Shewanella insulae]
MDEAQNDMSLTKAILANLKWPSPEQLLSQLDEVIVFGTGGAAESITRVLAEHQVKILCYVDNEPSKQQQVFHGKPVIAPQQLDKATHPVLIASSWAKDIAEQLRQLGCGYLDFSFCVDFPRWKDHFNCQVFDAKSAVRNGQKYLSGEDLDSFLGCIRYRQTYDPLYLSSPRHDHYLSQTVAPMPSDIYIDGGAWQGDTLLELKALCGDAIEIHSFEPDAHNSKMLADIIASQGIPNCFVVQKALWDQETTLRFIASSEAGHSMQSRVSTDGSSQQQMTEVSATPLDIYCQAMEPKPTYIKLDVEGAEPQALAGAANLLRSTGPKLAISAYHEPNHLWQLIEQVSNLNSAYRFWFVHHSQHLLESVIYAKVGK